MVGARDLCAKCFGALPQHQRDVLDRYRGAAPDTWGGMKYRAELAASIHVLDGMKPQVRQKNYEIAGSTGPRAG